MCDHLFLLQSQSEQSGSEQDSAVESPLVDSVDSDSQQVVIFHMDVIYIYLYFGCNLLYKYDVFSFTLVVL